MGVISQMIDQRIEKQLCEIGFREEKINKIILFGSRATGDNTEKSDIDLAFVAPEMIKKEWIKFTFDLEDELDTLLFLDLIKFEDIPYQMKNEINETGKAIYRKEI